MLDKEMKEILSDSSGRGWILEPEAKRILSLAGLPVPKFIWTKDWEEMVRFSEKIGFPLVAKIVSSRIVHKSDMGGVITGIADRTQLSAAFERLRACEDFEGVLLEESVGGIELIGGAKIDYQFGPVILIGIGGTGVEIYEDVSLKMAPLNENDIASMFKCLKAQKLLQGYRGADGVNIEKLTDLLLLFSHLVMEMEGCFESIDLNPIMCSSEECTIVDARIMLPQNR